ncbi:MAG: alpha/beta fold hydrolase [Myxococcota bacterium]
MSLRLRHGKIELALHTLRAPGGDGTAKPRLLLLHGLGEASFETLPEELAAWPGSVHALDFTGHGASSVPRGGGYTAELLMADADTALAHLGPATVCGRGLGAYVALLLAGARPESVRGAILCDGPGLAGGGSQPLSPFLASVDAGAVPPPDPFALMELARDLRPPDYATAFARQVTHFSGRDQPISVCAVQRPEWLLAVSEEPGVETRSLAEALAAYSSEA